MKKEIIDTILRCLQYSKMKIRDYPYQQGIPSINDRLKPVEEAEEAIRKIRDKQKRRKK